MKPDQKKIEEWTKIEKEVAYIYLSPGGIHIDSNDVIWQMDFAARGRGDRTRLLFGVSILLGVYAIASRVVDLWMALGIGRMLAMQKSGIGNAQEFVFSRSEEMRRRAFEVNDTIVQRLAVSHMALSLGRPEASAVIVGVASAAELRASLPPDAGFEPVQRIARERLQQDLAWPRTDASRREVAARLAALQAGPLSMDGTQVTRLPPSVP